MATEAPPFQMILTNTHWIYIPSFPGQSGEEAGSLATSRRVPSTRLQET